MEYETGRMISEGIIPKERISLDINLNGIPAGLYLLKVVTGGNNHVLKVMTE